MDNVSKFLEDYGFNIFIVILISSHIDYAIIYSKYFPSLPLLPHLPCCLDGGLSESHVLFVYPSPFSLNKRS